MGKIAVIVVTFAVTFGALLAKPMQTPYAETCQDLKWYRTWLNNIEKPFVPIDDGVDRVLIYDFYPFFFIRMEVSFDRVENLYIFNLRNEKETIKKYGYKLAYSSISPDTPNLRVKVFTRFDIDYEKYKKAYWYHSQVPRKIIYEVWFHKYDKNGKYVGPVVCKFIIMPQLLFYPKYSAKVIRIK